MNNEDKQLRNAIFSLHTRRFGKVAEIMIQKLLAFERGKNQYHDLYDANKKLRVEVKFSRAQKKEQTITGKNVIKSLENVLQFDERIFASADWKKNKFDCNIQQVKPKEFDLLYYGVFFADIIMIFKLTPTELGSEINFSDKQHKGNVGEGQFHLNNKSFQYHLDNFFYRSISYNELKTIFSITTSNNKIEIVN